MGLTSTPFLLLVLVFCQATSAGQQAVKTVVEKKCLYCHEADGIAPLDLTSPGAFRDFGDAIKASVLQKRMPPWPPEGGTCQPLDNELRLTPEELKAFQGWDTSLPFNKAPKAPAQAPTRSMKNTGTITYTIPQSHKLGFGDEYRCYYLKSIGGSEAEFFKDRIIVGYEALPGNPSVVHHATAFSVVRKQVDMKKITSKSGFSCDTVMDFGENSGIKTIGTWFPSAKTIFYPENTGISYNPEEEILVLRLHYSRYNLKAGAAKHQSDRTQVKIWARPKQNVRSLSWLIGGYRSSDSLPPGKKDIQVKSQKSFSKTFSKVPKGSVFKAWGALPHMHYAGSSIRMTRGGACVISIKNWNFGWQSLYFFKSPMVFSPEDEIVVECSYDTSGRTTPTHFGLRTEDEMCFVLLVGEVIP